MTNLGYESLDVVGGMRDLIICFTVRELGEEDVREMESLVACKTTL